MKEEAKDKGRKKVIERKEKVKAEGLMDLDIENTNEDNNSDTQDNDEDDNIKDIFDPSTKKEIDPYKKALLESSDEEGGSDKDKG